MTAVAKFEPTAIEVAAVTPVMTVDQAMSHLNTLREFRKKVLVQGTDYGVIPGTDKPTLFKPGAEKLANIFGLAIEHQVVEKVEDWDKGLFSYTVRCVIRSRRDGGTVADCLANCNSREDRYRYRNIFEWEATDEQKAKAVKVSTRKKKKGTGTYKVYQLENTEPFSLVNTLQKMAQKRAMVGAVLIATRASEEYTQDVEDLAPVATEEEPPAPTGPAPDNHSDIPHDAGTGEVLDPASEAQLKLVLEEAAKAGLTKDTFPEWYAEVIGRPWKQLYEQDCDKLLAAALKKRQERKAQSKSPAAA